MDNKEVCVVGLGGVGVSDNIRNFIGNGHLLNGLIYITTVAAKDFSIHHTSSYGDVHIGYWKQKQSESATSSLNRDITLGRQNELETFSDNYLNQHPALG